MNLCEVKEGQSYVIKEIKGLDEQMKNFLLTLGCYVGEPIFLISKIFGGCIVGIKDARYNIDKRIAKNIYV